MDTLDYSICLQLLSIINTLGSAELKWFSDPIGMGSMELWLHVYSVYPRATGLGKEQNMKAAILTLIISLSVFAKVSDFNALIADDTNAQKELHSKLKKQVYSQEELDARSNIVRTKKIAKPETFVYVDEVGTQVNAPSNDKYFKFKKEDKQKSTNPRKNQHRVAKEVRELGI